MATQSKFDASRLPDHSKVLLDELKRITKALEKAQIHNDTASIGRLKKELSDVTIHLKEVSSGTASMVMALTGATRGIKELAAVTAVMDKGHQYTKLVDNYKAAPNDQMKSMLLFDASVLAFASAAESFGKYVAEMLPMIREGKINSTELMGGAVTAFKNFTGQNNALIYTPEVMAKLLKTGVESIEGNHSNVGFGQTLPEMAADLAVALKQSLGSKNAAYANMAPEDKSNELLSFYEMERRSTNLKGISDQKFLTSFDKQMGVLQIIKDNTGVSAEKAGKDLLAAKQLADLAEAGGTLPTEMKASFSAIVSTLNNISPHMADIYRKIEHGGGIEGGTMVGLADDEAERQSLQMHPEINEFADKLRWINMNILDPEKAAEAVKNAAKETQLNFNTQTGVLAARSGYNKGGSSAVENELRNFQSNKDPSTDLKEHQNYIDPALGVFNTMSLFWETTIGSMPGQVVTKLGEGIALLIGGKGLVKAGTRFLGKGVSSVKALSATPGEIAGNNISQSAEAMTGHGAAEFASKGLAESTGKVLSPVGTVEQIAASIKKPSAGPSLGGTMTKGFLGKGLLVGAVSGAIEYGMGKLIDMQSNAMQASILDKRYGNDENAKDQARARTDTIMDRGIIGDIKSVFAGGSFFPTIGREQEALTAPKEKVPEVNNSEYTIQGSLDSQNLHLSSIKDILSKSLSIQTQLLNVMLATNNGMSTPRLVPKGMPNVLPDFSGDKAPSSISQAPVTPGSPVSGGQKAA